MNTEQLCIFFYYQTDNIIDIKTIINLSQVNRFSYNFFHEKQHILSYYNDLEKHFRDVTLNMSIREFKHLSKYSQSSKLFYNRIFYHLDFKSRIPVHLRKYFYKPLFIQLICEKKINPRKMVLCSKQILEFVYYNFWILDIIPLCEIKFIGIKKMEIIAKYPDLITDNLASFDEIKCTDYHKLSLLSNNINLVKELNLPLSTYNNYSLRELKVILECYEGFINKNITFNELLQMESNDLFICSKYKNLINKGILKGKDILQYDYNDLNYKLKKYKSLLEHNIISINDNCIFNNEEKLEFIMNNVDMLQKNILTKRLIGFLDTSILNRLIKSDGIEALQNGQLYFENMYGISKTKLELKLLKIKFTNLIQRR